MTETPPTQAAFTQWQCYFCGFFYDEALGLPEAGIAAGTRWSEIPDEWTCPECGAMKSDFHMIEVEA